MNMDDTIRKAIFHLTTAGEVKWNDPQRLGIKDPYSVWYYAEKEQYIIRDAMTDMYFFVKARSPKEALKIYHDRLDEAMKAGTYQEEIKVGDEVERILNGEVDSKAVFLEVDEGYYRCLFWTGCCFTTLSYPKKQFRKTGRHFPEINAVLEKMRGEQK